mmetsp:Transcript_46265/g.133271  ORF Transcript_46265/g.133271 Transcript_46265/m.133271 type:complete len:93 (+) Transcript_46265:881-1159(+)
MRTATNSQESSPWLFTSLDSEPPNHQTCRAVEDVAAGFMKGSLELVPLLWLDIDRVADGDRYAKESWLQRRRARILIIVLQLFKKNPAYVGN